MTGFGIEYQFQTKENVASFAKPVYCYFYPVWIRRKGSFLQIPTIKRYIRSVLRDF